MRRHLGLVAAALLGAAVVGGATVPPREPTPGVRPTVRLGHKTGYFSMSRVLKESHRAADSAKELHDRRETQVRNLDGLRAMARDLQLRALIARPPAVRERVERELVVVERQIEDTEREAGKRLGDRAGGLIAGLYDEVQETVAEMARENGLAVVLAHPIGPAQVGQNPLLKELMLKPPALQPFFIDPSVDYTDELIRRLNRKHDERTGRG